MSKREKQILAGILILAAFLVFFRLARHDMLTDDGHYSVRAIGYFDYLGSKEQTTPIQWFGHRPAWSYLSFHDHPPLVFLIQHIFFGIFGESVFVSRLPSALAALGSILAAFFIARRLFDIRTALLAALLLAVNNYFIWTSRIALLEGVFMFFFLLVFLYLLKSLENEKYFVHAGIFFGLSLLSKYTVLFALPAAALYLLWRERRVFRSKKFWQGIAAFVLLSLPIVIYNLAMLKTRGHFDVQFADLAGQVHNDWTKLERRISDPHPDVWATIKTLPDAFSWPYFAGFLAALLASFGFARRQPRLYLILASTIVMFGLMTLAGGAIRWLGVLSPFVAIILAGGIAKLAERNRLAAATAAAVPVLFSVFYTLNSNNFITPVGGPKWHANFRLENMGYNQLDREMTRLLSGKKPAPKIAYAATQWWYRDIEPEAIAFPEIREGRELNAILIIDSEHIWFPMAWIKERWKLYHRFSIKTTSEFLQIVEAEEGLEVLKFIEFEKIYYFKSGPRVRETADLKHAGRDVIYEAVKKQNLEPKIIYDDQGREAFYMYELTSLAL